MKFQKRHRLATKIQLKCFQCRLDCLPKNGDWHDGEESQVFLCRTCEMRARTGMAPLMAKVPKLRPQPLLA